MIGQKKAKVFWHQLEARITPTVLKWSVKTLSPGSYSRSWLFFAQFFFLARLDLFPPPLTAPGSPRMGSTLPRSFQPFMLCLICRLRKITSLSFTRVSGWTLNWICSFLGPWWWSVARTFPPDHSKTKARFIRCISAASNAVQTKDNEANHLIICCLNCIWHGRNATYEPGLRILGHKQK